MIVDLASSAATGIVPSRRQLLQSTPALIAAAGIPGAASAQSAPATASEPRAQPTQPATRLQGTKIVGFMLAHEQFPVPELVRLGGSAAKAGFGALATSDHLQPWQANERHCGQAWVTLSSVGSRAPSSWIGTTVTCPTMRYNPAVVAEAFASLSLLYPGRVFLGVGSGEALNEEVATGMWPKWPERWERLVEAIGIIRDLWGGQQVSHRGKYYTIDAKLYDPPAQPIPLLTAANGKKSMRLAGQYGDGLITDPKTWQQYKSEWEAGARGAGKNPADMPVLVEQFVVVGDKNDARQAAELWRFIPKAFKKYYDVADPAEIERQADQQMPLDQVFADWPIGTDPSVHVDALNKLFDSGVTIVNVHSGQPDQEKVIAFYADHVLPNFRNRS
ncbi:MAG TPA: TIGR03557 family F420-dependent LLM class oxidoreductase [Stellaceae bacterium]|jgi:TAT-translocated FGD2 family F420-dependent dehydrogenase|nr:TIGR03557 family F420-dependent LLM class oxidoreductase [Stellaceae bacterium]